MKTNPNQLTPCTGGQSRLRKWPRRGIMRRVMVGLAWLAVASPLQLHLAVGAEHPSLSNPNSFKLARNLHDEAADVGEEIELQSLEVLELDGSAVPVENLVATNATVFVFIGTECPLVKLYVPRLVELKNSFSDQQIRFVAIDSNQQDSLEEMETFRRRHRLEMELYRDPSNQLADRLGAERTPHVVVIDSDHHLRYRGRIDDQYGVGYAKNRPGTNDLQDAVTAIVAGNEVRVPETNAVGCKIGRKRTINEEARYTYVKDIAPILEKHCVECHQDGEIGPFALAEFEEVQGWAEMIGEVVAEGRMPPWSADPSVGTFENERGMTSLEKEKLFEWIRDGAPLGVEDAVSSEASTNHRAAMDAKTSHAEESAAETNWLLGREPDVILSMSHRPFEVPAEGVVEYQYFVVDPGFEKDRWVTAAQVIPGARTVVHHAIVFFRAPDSGAMDHLGWIGAYVPGQRTAELPSGMARRVPAGARLVFQMHYTPNGQVQNDVTKVALYFANEKEVVREVITIPVLEHEFELEPFKADQVVSKSVSGFPKGGELLSVTPHMHFRGASFELSVSTGESDKTSGSRAESSNLVKENESTILRVPNYDFNWQHTYRFESPIPLIPEMTFECRNVFDNSAENLANPDPSVPVRWGDQTFQEMAITFFDIALPVGFPAEELFARRTPIEDPKDVRATAQQFIQRFDKNSDAQLSRNEVPHVFATLGFHRYDLNDDGAITFDEACRFQIQRQGR